MWVPAQESIRFPKYFSNLVVHIIYVYLYIVVVTALSVGYSYFPLSMAWGKHGSNAIVHLFTWSLVHWKCLPPFEWMWHPKMTRAHGPWIMSDSRCKDSKNVYTFYFSPAEVQEAFSWWLLWTFHSSFHGPMTSLIRHPGELPRAVFGSTEVCRPKWLCVPNDRSNEDKNYIHQRGHSFWGGEFKISLVNIFFYST